MRRLRRWRAYAVLAGAVAGASTLGGCASDPWRADPVTARQPVWVCTPAPEGRWRCEHGDAAAVARRLEPAGAAPVAASDAEPLTAPAPEVAPAETLEGAPAPAAPAPEAADLSAWPPGHYTIQVAAVSSSAALDDFLARYPQRAFVTAETLEGGRRWFVVLAGVYADRVAAQRALAALPADLQRAGPYVRRVGDVQRAARRAREAVDDVGR